MTWRRRLLALFAIALFVGMAFDVATPCPEHAEAASLPCEIGATAGGFLTGAGGIGNPVGDVCGAITGTITKPVTDALKGIGNGIFEQVTTWVAEGSAYLIEQVSTAIDKTTTPDLTARGFLMQYGKMSAIAALLAAATLLLVIVDAVAHGSWSILGRAIFVNLPLAFLGTSVAFAMVQLLLTATDGLSHAVAAGGGHGSTHLFKAALDVLGHVGASGGGEVGSGTGPVNEAAAAGTGKAATPLFVTVLVAIVGGFAAFAIWLEMLMRDAAVYVVALFLPLTFGAAIWPRWMGALRRTAELMVVVIASKFVVVSIIGLAVLLAAHNNGGIEPLLVATALMVLTSFAPFVLMRFVPFAEGAAGAAYGRRSAASTAGGTSGQALSHVQTIRNLTKGGQDRPLPEVWNVKGEGGGGGSKSGGGGPSKPGSPASTASPAKSSGAAGGEGKAAGGAEVGAGAAAGEAAGPVGAAVGIAAGTGVAAEKGAKRAADRMSESAIAQTAGASPSSAGGAGGTPNAAAGSAPDASGGEPPAASQPKPPRPPEQLPLKDESGGSK
jgi:hypothetical protein